MCEVYSNMRQHSSYSRRRSQLLTVRHWLIKIANMYCHILDRAYRRCDN